MITFCSPARSQPLVIIILSSGTPFPTLKVASSEASARETLIDMNRHRAGRASTLGYTTSMVWESAYVTARLTTLVRFHPLTTTFIYPPRPPIHATTLSLSLSHLLSPTTLPSYPWLNWVELSWDGLTFLSQGLGRRVHEVRTLNPHQRSN